MRLTEQQVLSARQALSALVGLPLTDMWRNVDCQKFEFGEQKPFANASGEEVMCAEWGLVASCDWRIVGPDGFALLSDHFDRVRLDDFASDFYCSLASNPPVVQAVAVLENGALRFRMSRGFSLSLDPCPGSDVHIEDWRLMPPVDDSRGHLVLDPNDLSWRAKLG